MSAQIAKKNKIENFESFDKFINEFYSFVKARSLYYRNRDGRQEENFRQDVNLKLRDYLVQSNLDLTIDNEFSLTGAGRVDSLIDKVIIEYKSPGLLKRNNNSTTNEEGINKVKEYITALSLRENRPLNRYRAVVFDGSLIIFCKFVGREFVADDTIPFSKSSARVFLSTISSVNSGYPFTPDKLTESFGPASETAKKVIENLYDSLFESTSPKTSALFEQWKSNFAQASEFTNKEDKALAL